MSGQLGSRNFLRCKAQHASEITFGDVFQRAGYATGIFGKWKQSRGSNEVHGKDYIFAFGWDEFCCFDVVGEVQRYINPNLVINGEIHNYRGVFGSHVGNVIRRLRRVANFYGSDPQFICCSATIANPQDLAQRLVGADVKAVTESSAPRGARSLLLWNPPVINRDLGIRASARSQSTRIARQAHDGATDNGGAEDLDLPHLTLLEDLDAGAALPSGPDEPGGGIDGPGGPDHEKEITL